MKWGSRRGPREQQYSGKVNVSGARSRGQAWNDAHWVVSKKVTVVAGEENKLGSETQGRQPQETRPKSSRQ